MQKGVLFDGHKREDVFEYRKTFFEEMKALSPYFAEFGKDGSILPKEYLKDCKVDGSNQRPIIIIKHDESTFSTNNGRQKLWTLEEHGILCPKGRGKRIMILDFLFPWSRLNFLSLL